MKALSDYVKDIRPQLVFDPREKALFVNMSGERMSRQGFWKIVKYYQEKAQINKDITPHTLADPDARGVQELQHGMVPIALGVHALRLLQKQLHLFVSGF